VKSIITALLLFFVIVSVSAQDKHTASSMGVVAEPGSTPITKSYSCSDLEKCIQKIGTFSDAVNEALSTGRSKVIMEPFMAVVVERTKQPSLFPGSIKIEPNNFQLILSCQIVPNPLGVTDRNLDLQIFTDFGKTAVEAHNRTLQKSKNNYAQVDSYLLPRPRIKNVWLTEPLVDFEGRHDDIQSIWTIYPKSAPK